MPRADHYFQGKSVEGTGQMQFANNVSLKFSTCFGKPSIEFIGNAETANERHVILTSETWFYLCDMIPMLRRGFFTLANATPHVNQLYADFVNYTHENYHLKNSAPGSILQDVRMYLNDLNIDTMTKDVPADAGLDKAQVFYELIHFCIYDIAGAIRPAQ
jgi:hypothetical protein